MAGALKIDLEDFTLDEIDEMEDLTGKPFGEMFSSAAGLKAAYFITKRREDPGFSWDDAGKVKVRDVTVGESADPTDAAAG